ncbi:intradiol ring-cleavage dioxygenase [Methylobacterium nonmethylotrophicum]|uniref:Intradiol ring-cleavage dioxygenase n=1 Tax=Methylobacterium nonmethylotrophicum TaxID=1141884 RepID=A0A4Z0NS11_9HYPH|nr:intradiol ring-cleavage dioxygenase [Methylobacterium nonmethylotrophicum]TGD99340.1 intradiol ring-cleavage dioxygenase [Methylobacterium nonmethylotrophicum]
MADRPTRRVMLGTLAAGLLVPGPARATCLLTPQAVEGPFYLDPRLLRSDIREDRAGTPLTVSLDVATLRGCTALPEARVDLWHADAQGRYSGYPDQGDRGGSTVGQTFLRGTQFADRAGRVSFRTIFPGWYPGRTPHLHVKVILAGRTALTGQIYFPDAVSEAVYQGPDYAGRPKRGRIGNARDALLRQDDPEGRGIAAVHQAGAGYEAALTLVVRGA